MAQYRLIEVDNPVGVKSWVIEKKSCLGYWFEPHITYADDATFYNQAEAEKWFDYLTGKTKRTTKQLRP